MNKRVCCFVVFALMSELVVSCVWSQENQIINSEFDDGLNAWGSYGAAGFTIEVVRDAGLSGKNGALLDVTDASAGGAIGLAQSGLLLEPGVTYPIGFTARAEQDREMVLLLQTNLNSVSWPTQVNQKMNLTTKPQEYFFEYTHSGNTYGDEAGETVTLYLMLKGAFWPMVGDDLNKKVWFDRVYFGAEPPQPRRDLADDPNPGDQSTDVPRITDLSWQPGIHADTHDVYLGANFDDVNTADPSNPLGVLVSQGQEAMSYGPESVFDFEQIYYWRVDEVNAAPDSTVFKGAVWSFMVEPFSIPISNITATASSSFGASGPEKTIDGSGLADDLHGVSAADMWISADVPAAIEYAFDRAYKLHELWIWNSNQLIEAFVGFGAKDVVIEHSLDGENWTVLNGVGPLAQAPGADGYVHNTTIDFGGAAARHVRVTVNSVQGIAPQASLSELRFFYIPTAATRPSPETGASGVSPHVTLSWGRGGREADRHEIYLGTDAADLPLVGSVNESSFDTSASDLQLGQTYHWRVDEVNDAMDPSVWSSDTWSFTTAGTILIDDMESYQDVEFLEIWATWIDGFDDPSNGALVGADPAIGDFAPETGIVHGGSQSLSIWFDNGAAAFSEATRTFDQTQDWSRSGVQTLALSFLRGADNTGNGQLYVKINGTQLVYQEDGAGLPPGWDVWTQWRIDLSALGADLTRVRSLTVGVKGAGAKGVLYVDDIQLDGDPAGTGSQQVVTWFEAESGTITAPLEVFSDDPTASGGQYIGTVDGSGDSNSNPPADGVATYSITVPEDGVYRLAFRVVITGGSNSFWVRIPGMATNTGNHASGWVRFNDIQDGDAWHWDEVHSNDDSNQVVDFTLSAGTHTLEIARREDGTLLDAIAVLH